MNRSLSFPEILHQRADRQPDAIACRFFKGPALLAEALTFRELWEQAAGLADRLRSEGLSGQRALLICKSQRNFVIAFYACLLAGTVAVPAAAPKRQSLSDRLQLIAGDARARAVIFDIDEIEQTDFHSSGDALVKLDLRVCGVGDGLVAHGGFPGPSSFADSAPAFLQYTSGSTGDPKGVVVSHGNLTRNCAVIAEAMDLSETSSLFTALPLFHDMGLVGGVLQLTYSGCVASFLSPAEFVQYPERWLQIISKFQVTVSGGPNFMYDLAARVIKPAEIAGIDLSAWRVAFCGAEPIRAATIARFTQRFESAGFRPEAFYPCYGMAESTLFITGAQVDAVPAVDTHEGGEVVGCGTPRGDTRIAIVDPDTRTRVPDGGSGEIWVRGGSVAQGYWMRPELTKTIFQAALADADADDDTPYLRTGDLGFVKAGELYVAGRLKDLIIINGKKYVPQDLEDECERSHGALRQSGGAAFDVSNGDSEQLVIVFELKREWLRRHLEWSQIKSAIHACVGTTFGIAVTEVVLIKPGALPRTSSGKVRRSQCRTDYLASRLERVASGAIA